MARKIPDTGRFRVFTRNSDFHGKALIWMNLALAVLVIAAGACRIRVNHLVNAESMNIKKTSGIKEVALTFADGPSPECTKDLLEGLKERNV